LIWQKQNITAYKKNCGSSEWWDDMDEKQMLAEIEKLHQTVGNLRDLVVKQGEEIPVKVLDSGKRYKFEPDGQTRIFLHAGNLLYCFVNVDLSGTDSLYCGCSSLGEIKIKTKEGWLKILAKNNIRLTQVDE
jgi:hypothetical protein